jgi:hypothetical protein
MNMEELSAVSYQLSVCAVPVRACGFEPEDCSEWASLKAEG